ncbi:MAG TPA: enoyl-CoA hydratase/isomerase family protein [Acidimicrobiales bacterium]|nr:enoyl-CoA hydratase/isomerase family protein [Acidimicrobiales bacterium]
MTDTPQFQRIKLSRTGRTAVLTLASDKVNALDRDVLDEVTACVDRCERDPDIGALVVTGAGSLFSAGVNVKDVLDNDTAHTGELLSALSTAVVSLFRCSKPTVAAINGSAIAGGCLLACACDQRLVADDARIGVTELRVGVAFPTFAIELLKHACGPKAEQLVFDARLLDADEACRFGLAHRCLPRSELDAAAMASAEQLASLDARAYGLAKASIRRAALSAMDDEVGRLLDRQVSGHWQADQTRANLERLLKPKG